MNEKLKGLKRELIQADNMLKTAYGRAKDLIEEARNQIRREIFDLENGKENDDMIY
jgi:vacuolar-type H+-ATPase subunit H